MLELAILGLLIESPMHGYELRKRLTGLLGAFRAFSYGSLYPALRRMQVEGLIAENAAPAGTPVRRARRGHPRSRRRPQVEGRREGLRDAVARASSSFDRYTRQLHQLGLESSEREVKWLNELIAAERAAPGLTEQTKTTQDIRDIGNW